ncbi:MAG TPA: T9SS type A sorting domain-containing protein [Bacteroidota bacterium]|nr:T9SS type A sorting domain-containing protein [Bacteroidota bacterium]
MAYRPHLLLCLLLTIPWVARTQTDYWVATNGPGTGYDVRSLTVTSNGTLYAGTWTDGSIWKTTDLGGSWTICGWVPNPNPVLSMCTLPNDHIFACVFESGVFRSTDGGATWQQRNSLLSNFAIRGSVVDDLSNVWVATDTGLFCSSNEGTTWTLKKLGEAGQGGGFAQVYLDSSHAIVTNDWYNLFRSTDHGSTWTTTPFGTPIVSVGGVHPDGSYYASSSTSGIFRSTDFGTTWIDLHSGLNWSGGTYTFTFSAGGKVFYGRQWNGIVYSGDSGKTWVSLNSGLTTNGVSPLLRHPYGYIFVGTGGAGVFRSLKVADAPLAIGVSPPTCDFGGVRTGARDTLALSITNTGIVDTLNVSSIVSTDPHFVVTLSKFAVLPGGGQTVGVIYTPTKAEADTGSLHIASNAPGSPLVIIPLSGTGYVPSAAPTIVSLALVPNTSFSARIVWVKSTSDSSGAVDPATEYSVWRRVAGSGDPVWAFMSSVPAIGLSQYAVDEPIPSLSGTGATWYSFMVAVQTKGLQTYFSAPDSIKDPPLTGVDGQSALDAPSDVVIRQNFPNPFNPATTIEYGLPRATRVTLIVYNALGQAVARLVDDVETAGYHRATFDGSALASGVYFCRLVAGSFVRTSRMLLLK